jgi:hypothetical protein
VSANGNKKYPDGMRGSCGDPHWETKWDNPQSVQTSYYPGQVINVDVVVAVNHMGHFKMQARTRLGRGAL